MNRGSQNNMNYFSPLKIQRYKLVVRLSGRHEELEGGSVCAAAYIRKIGLKKDLEKIRNAEMGKIREKKNASCTTFMENKRGSASTLREVTTWKRLSL
jgi:hypothetical protein